MTDDILVHISTPATRQNDELFRSLTEAYVGFVPHTRHGDDSRQGLDGYGLTSVSELRTNVAPKGPLQVAGAETSILSTSKDSYGSFPSHLSFEGHADGHNKAETQPDHGSFDDGSVPTSSRLARLDRIQARWKEQKTPRFSFINGHRQARRSSRTPENADTAFIEDTQLAAQALQSQLHDTYSTTSEYNSEDEPEPQASLYGVKSVYKAQRNTGCQGMKVLPSAQATPPAVYSKAPATRRETLPSSPTFTLESSLPPGQASEQVQRGVNKSDNFLQGFGKLPLDAFPPVPEVSTERPCKLPSQITKHLAAIKAQNPKRFQPSSKRTTPKSDDRGYWSVNGSRWPANLQHEFWTSLCEHVSSGRLGWGATLHRDPSSAYSLGSVRLYCWAEVVEHVWLLLWLCSKGRIAGSGSKWIDADGDAVFEVP